MRRRPSQCSAHLCLLGHTAPGGRHTCLFTCAPAPLTFTHNHIEVLAFPVDAVVYSTALTMNIIAISWAPHFERVIVESRRLCGMCLGLVSRLAPELGIEPGPVGLITVHATT